MPRIYKAGESSITVLGVTYTADEDGIITIPDAGFSKSVYQKGWVLAKGRDAQLARERQAAMATPAESATTADAQAAIDKAVDTAMAATAQPANKTNSTKAATAQP